MRINKFRVEDCDQREHKQRLESDTSYPLTISGLQPRTAETKIVNQKVEEEI